jgi:hypothetical protein
MFSLDAQEFITGSDSMQQIEKDSEYGKMVLLLFEETYQHTDRHELIYQTRSLLGRLIDFYVNTKKTQIITKLEEAEDAEEQKLLKDVNKLQGLKNEVLIHYDEITKEQL